MIRTPIMYMYGRSKSAFPQSPFSAEFGLPAWRYRAMKEKRALNSELKKRVFGSTAPRSTLKRIEKSRASLGSC